MVPPSFVADCRFRLIVAQHLPLRILASTNSYLNFFLREANMMTLPKNVLITNDLYGRCLCGTLAIHPFHSKLYDRFAPIVLETSRTYL